MDGSNDMRRFNRCFQKFSERISHSTFLIAKLGTICRYRNRLSLPRTSFVERSTFVLRMNKKLTSLSFSFSLTPRHTHTHTRTLSLYLTLVCDSKVLEMSSAGVAFSRKLLPRTGWGRNWMSWNSPLQSSHRSFVRSFAQKANPTPLGCCY